MNAPLQTSRQLTRERFRELLEAYRQAFDEAAWLGMKQANSPEHAAALEDMRKALAELERAVFP